MNSIVAILVCTHVFAFANASRVMVHNAKADSEPQRIESKDWLPEGRFHDFGTHAAGVVVQHAIPIRNPSDQIVEIIDARVSGGATTVRVQKLRIEPKEETKVQLSMDTRRFRGRKTQNVYVTARAPNGDLLLFVLTVTCESREPADASE